MDLLAPMRTFVRVVEAGSFTAVAAELRTTQPTVSRQVAALEEHLGTRLLARTTRTLTLTEEGRAFYEHALRALEAITEAESAVGRRRTRPSGLLRLATPVVFGRLHVVPRLPRFLARFPEISVDVAMSDGFTDLIEDGIDLAIRVGETTDPGLVARRIGETRRITVASPAYLKAWGTPRTPAELVRHDCVVYSRLATGARWIFERDGVPTEVEVSGRLRTNNSEGVRAAVLAGLGIGLVPAWHFGDEIARGDLRILLSAYEPRRLPICAVRPSRRFVPPKVREMIAFLAAEFRLEPQLSGHRS